LSRQAHGTIGVVGTYTTNTQAQQKAAAAAAAAVNLAATKRALEDLRTVTFEVDSDVEPHTAISWIQSRPER